MLPGITMSGTSRPPQASRPTPTNSAPTIMPSGTADLFAAQESWLKSELQQARGSGATHIVIFQHYPWFLQSPDEAEQYFNLPTERRTAYLGLFHEFGVKAVFCGHYHRNSVARDGSLEIVTTSALGKPLGGSQSGIQVVIVRDTDIEHRFYDLGEIPNRIDLHLNGAGSGNSI